MYACMQKITSLFNCNKYTEPRFPTTVLSSKWAQELKNALCFVKKNGSCAC